MFMYGAIGPGHGPEELGYAADGIIAHAVIPGIEGIGDKTPPQPPEEGVISNFGCSISNLFFNIISPGFRGFLKPAREITFFLEHRCLTNSCYG
jgi:hypothetical protein